MLLYKLRPTSIEEPQNDEDVVPEQIKGLHQSGINAVDFWFDFSKSSNVIIATVGDDTRISMLEVDLKTDYMNEIPRKIVRDRAHASAIVGIKFLNKTTIVTVSKDQRLIVWKIESDLISPIRVLFIDVADASSMESIQIRCFLDFFYF